MLDRSGGLMLQTTPVIVVSRTKGYREFVLDRVLGGRIRVTDDIDGGDAERLTHGGRHRKPLAALGMWQLCGSDLSPIHADPRRDEVASIGGPGNHQSIDLRVGWIPRRAPRINPEFERVTRQRR